MRPLRKAKTIRVYKTKLRRIQPGFPAPRNNAKPSVFCIRRRVFSFFCNRELRKIKQSQTIQQLDSVTLKPGVHKFFNDLGATSKLCASSKSRDEDRHILGDTVRTAVDMATLGPGICSHLPQTSLLGYFKIYQSFLSLGNWENRNYRTDNGFCAISRTGFCPVIGHNPGSLLTFLLDIPRNSFI
jgi:hypothetical protein